MFRFIKFNIKMTILLCLVGIFTFIYVTKDEIKENGFLFKLNNDNKIEAISKLTDKEQYEIYKKLEEYDIFKEDISDLEIFMMDNINYLNEDMKRKLFNLYLEKLEKRVEYEQIYLDIYELDILNYFNTIGKLSEENYKKIEKQDFLKNFLIRVSSENLLITKTNYIERYKIEIDYTKLINKFENYLSQETIRDLKSKRKNSLQYTIRSKSLYE